MNTEKLVTVWLVEDNARYRGALARIIDESGQFHCDADFGSAEETLHALESKKPPDVLLLDVGLPGMDGIAAMHLLHRAAELMKIVILTVFDDHDRIFRAICSGADGYLLKTSSIAEVERAITEVMRGGASMSPEIARKVLDQYTGRNQVAKSESLTDRESEVLVHVVEGLTKREIAAKLGLSQHTVDSHLRNIYQKLHVRNRAGAVAAAMRDRLI